MYFSFMLRFGSRITNYLGKDCLNGENKPINRDWFNYLIFRLPLYINITTTTFVAYDDFFLKRSGKSGLQISYMLSLQNVLNDLRLSLLSVFRCKENVSFIIGKELKRNTKKQKKQDNRKPKKLTCLDNVQKKQQKKN